MKLGNPLKELRNGCGFSQDYLASLLNMSQSNYCRIEKNELSISNNKLEIVAVIYGFSLANLLNDTLKINHPEMITPKENVQMNIEDLLKLKEQIIIIQNRHIELLEEKVKSLQK